MDLMSKEQAFSLLKKIKPVIVEELIWFAYYNNTPIGFYLSLPELNEIFKYVNGNLNCWGKLKFKYHQLNKTCHTTFGVAFGIDPKFQGRGLEGALFDAHRKSILNSQFTDVIITWIGDFNPKMITIIENLGAKKIRTMATWRKLFDEKAVFERSPIIQ
jgi:hypothetical protein